MSAETIRHGALTSQRFLNVRRFGEDLCRDLRPKDYLSEAHAIMRGVQARTRYMRDPRTVELIKAPYIVVGEIQTGKKPQLDCDDLTALIAALTLACGHQTRIVTVAFQNLFHKGQRQYTHVFPQSREPRTGKWITLDPVPVPGGILRMHKRIIASRVYPIA